MVLDARKALPFKNVVRHLSSEQSEVSKVHILCALQTFKHEHKF